MTHWIHIQCQLSKYQGPLSLLYSSVKITLIGIFFYYIFILYYNFQFGSLAKMFVLQQANQSFNTFFSSSNESTQPFQESTILPGTLNPCLPHALGKSGFYLNNWVHRERKFKTATSGVVTLNHYII